MAAAREATEMRSLCTCAATRESLPTAVKAQCSTKKKKERDACWSQNTHCEARKSLRDFCCPHPICPSVLWLVFKVQLEAQSVLTCPPPSKDASLLQDPLEQDGEYDDEEEGKENDDD